MKIDFYAPKKYYGTHILAISGWITLFAFFKIVPLNVDNTQGGVGIIYAIVSLIPIWFLLLAIIVYSFEFFFKLKIKNCFLLQNKIYDYFFDAGIVFVLTPLFWTCYPTLKSLIPLAFVFLLIRALKFFQRKKGKESV